MSPRGRKDVSRAQTSPSTAVRIRVDVDCKLTRSFVVDVPAITENRCELHSVAEHVVREVIEERPDVWDRRDWRWLPESIWIAASDQAPDPDVSVTEDRAREVLEGDQGLLPEH